MRAPSRRRWLAGSAALAGVLAPLAGSPYRRAATETVDVAELARVVANQDDHVSAVQLAAWLREGQPRLRVVDVRSAPEFRAYHIPGAEHVPLDRLAAARFYPGEMIVLCSEAGAHGALARVLLRTLGHHRVLFLRGGLRAWLDDVMSPTLAADADAEAQAAFARVAELSRWFGGTPRRLTRSAAELPDDVPAAVRRRGC